MTASSHTFLNTRRVLGFLTILLIPLLSYAGLAIFAEARGPYYLQNNQDPDYCYLLNGLNILAGQSPGHTDHPGTTLQYFIAGVLRANQPHQTVETLTDEILHDPEPYLRRCSLALKFLVVLTLAGVGITALRCSGSILTSLLAQSAPLLFQEIMLSGTRVYPEALSISLCNLILCAILIIMYRPLSEPLTRHVLFVFLGCVTALLIDTKMLAAPVLVSGLLLALRARATIAFVTSFSLTLVGLLFLIRNRLEGMWKWVEANATHSDRYGQGIPGFINLDPFLQNLANVLRTHFSLTLLLGFASALVLLSLLPALRTRFRSARVPLCALLVCILLTLLLVCKSPAQHYLIVAFALAPALLVAIHQHLMALCGPSRWFAPIGSTLFVGLLLSLSLPALVKAHTQLTAQKTYADNAACNAQGIAASVQRINTYRSSTQEYALAFGNMYAGYQFTRRLQQLYPDSVDYNIWADALSRFGYADDPAAIPRVQSCLIQGTWLTDEVVGKIAAKLYPVFYSSEISISGGERTVLIHSGIAPK